MPQLDLQHELELACQLAREAGARIMQHYATDFQVDYKGSASNDPVTQADRDANSIIVDGLMAAFPADAILAEESEASASRHACRRMWCIDPLDGTREFIARNGQFVVMIGLAIDGESRLGVVYQPTEDILYWGSGNSSFCEAQGNRTAMRPSVGVEPSAATLMVSRSHRSKTVTRVAASLGVQREMPLGSVGLKVARVAEGVADAYISISNKTQEWDACAPEAILRAAGGAMTDTRGEPLRYNKSTTETTYGMLATNGPLHGMCVQALAPVVVERGW